MPTCLHSSITYICALHVCWHLSEEEAARQLELVELALSASQGVAHPQPACFLLGPVERPDVVPFVQSFECRHPPEFRGVPPYRVTVTDPKRVGDVRCETCWRVPCGNLCGRWFDDEAARAEHAADGCRGDQRIHVRGGGGAPPPKRARAGRRSAEQRV